MSCEAGNVEFYAERDGKRTTIHRIIKKNGDDKSREEASAALVYDSDLTENKVNKLFWVGEVWIHAEQARLAYLDQHKRGTS